MVKTLRTAAFAIMTVAFCALPACEGSDDDDRESAAAVLREADHGGAVSLLVGQVLQVELEGNPTTGYQWAVDACDGALLSSPPEPDYAQSSPGTIGGGGIYTFRFKALAPGRTLLKLKYHRAWENNPPLRTFQVTMTVT